MARVQPAEGRLDLQRAAARGPDHQTGSISIQVGNLDVAIAQATDQIHAWAGGCRLGPDGHNGVGPGFGHLPSPVNEFENALAVMRRLGDKV